MVSARWLMYAIVNAINVVIAIVINNFIHVIIFMIHTLRHYKKGCLLRFKYEGSYSKESA